MTRESTRTRQGPRYATSVPWARTATSAARVHARLAPRTRRRSAVLDLREANRSACAKTGMGACKTTRPGSSAAARRANPGTPTCSRKTHHSCLWAGDSASELPGATCMIFTTAVYLDSLCITACCIMSPSRNVHQRVATCGRAWALHKAAAAREYAGCTFHTSSRTPLIRRFPAGGHARARMPLGYLEVLFLTDLARTLPMTRAHGLLPLPRRLQCGSPFLKLKINTTMSRSTAARPPTAAPRRRWPGCRDTGYVPSIRLIVPTARRRVSCKSCLKQMLLRGTAIQASERTGALPNQVR